MNPFAKKRHGELPDFWKAYEAFFMDPQPTDLDLVTFAGLDTETTGFQLEQDRILSIGALLMKQSTIRVGDALEIYILQEHYDPETTRVHGILQNEGAHCISEMEALEQLLGYLKNAVIIGHHTSFDIGMINQAMRRHGLPALKNLFLDTAVLFRNTIIRSPLLQQKETYTLDELADRYDISLKDRHTAPGDAYITLIAFLNILNILKAKEKVTLKSLIRLT